MRVDDIGVTGAGTAGAVRPRAVATSTGNVSRGESTVSAARVARGGNPAAESTHAFMLARRTALELSRFTRCAVAVAAAAESEEAVLGGMNVAN